ncbi:MAG: helix-turn-helix transcriptional regulator [Oscillospiraceae bacterium]|nr:helix-turn-helix transcriptional regulator [Oscillospiraceae bacterium]
MYEINKEAFGSFVAALRKEKGLTQKELADRLYISNKAVSKWETGVTIPDTALLVPLAEALGVTVTELLKCQRLTQEESRQSEELVKTVIQLSEGEPQKYRSDRWKRGLQLLLCGLAGAAEIWLMLLYGYQWEEISQALLTIMVLMAVFGSYFCVFAKERLPDYYDRQRISSFSDGFLRMNIPGVYFNNSNWPYIVRVVQLWATIGLTGSPALYFLFRQLFPGFVSSVWVYILLLLTLGGMFIPIVILARKYEFSPDTPRPAYGGKKDWIWFGVTALLILSLALFPALSGLWTSGSGSRVGWHETKSLENWNAGYSYFQGYRQRIVNVKNDPATLHTEIRTEKGIFTLRITDLNNTLLYEKEFSESTILDIPIPGKVQVRVIGEGTKGSFCIGW